MGGGMSLASFAGQRSSPTSFTGWPKGGGTGSSSRARVRVRRSTFSHARSSSSLPGDGSSVNSVPSTSSHSDSDTDTDASTPPHPLPSPLAPHPVPTSTDSLHSSSTSSSFSSFSRGSQATAAVADGTPVPERTAKEATEAAGHSAHGASVGQDGAGGLETGSSAATSSPPCAASTAAGASDSVDLAAARHLPHILVTTPTNNTNTTNTTTNTNTTTTNSATNNTTTAVAATVTNATTATATASLASATRAAPAAARTADVDASCPAASSSPSAFSARSAAASSTASLPVVTAVSCHVAKSLSDVVLAVQRRTREAEVDAADSCGSSATDGVVGRLGRLSLVSTAPSTAGGAKGRDSSLSSKTRRRRHHRPRSVRRRTGSVHGTSPAASADSSLSASGGGSRRLVSSSTARAGEVTRTGSTTLSSAPVSPRSTSPTRPSALTGGSSPVPVRRPWSTLTGSESDSQHAVPDDSDSSSTSAFAGDGSVSSSASSVSAVSAAWDARLRDLPPAALREHASRALKVAESCLNYLVTELSASPTVVRGPLPKRLLLQIALAVQGAKTVLMGDTAAEQSESTLLPMPARVDTDDDEHDDRLSSAVLSKGPPHSPLLGESSYTGGTESVEGTETDLSAVVFEDADADDTEDPSEAEVRSRYAVPGGRLSVSSRPARPPQASATASDSGEGRGEGARVGPRPRSGHAQVRLCRREHTRVLAACERLWRRIDKHERLALEVAPALLTLSEDLVSYARTVVREVRTLQPRARPSFALASQRAHSQPVRTCAGYLMTLVAASRRLTSVAPTGAAARLKQVRTTIVELAASL